jgi:SAM-dependent methyltransferase
MAAEITDWAPPACARIRSSLPGPARRCSRSARVAEASAWRRPGRSCRAGACEFRVADATEPDLPDTCVDIVGSRFAYMAMPDPARALAESRRVLRPGGRLALAVWGTAERIAWASLAFQAIARRSGTSPPAPGAPGTFSLADPGRRAPAGGRRTRRRWHRACGRRAPVSVVPRMVGRAPGARPGRTGRAGVDARPGARRRRAGAAARRGELQLSRRDRLPVGGDRCVRPSPDNARGC